MNQSEDKKVISKIVDLVSSLSLSEQERILQMITIEKTYLLALRLEKIKDRRKFTDDEIALLVVATRIKEKRER